MADDVTLPGTAAVIATDDIGSGRQVQLIKPVFGPDGSATMVTPDVGLPTGVGSVVVSGTASALNADAIAATDVSGYQMMFIQLVGTFSGNLNVQASNDNTNWLTVNIQAVQAAGITTAGSASFSSTAQYYVAGLPFKYMRIRCVSYTSGSITAYARLMNGTFSTATPLTQGISGSVTSNGFNGASDTDADTYWGRTGSLHLGFNGLTWSRHRLPRIFKSITATASGDTAVWAPTTGKRWQLLRFQIFATADAAQTAGGVITVTLRDVTTSTGLAIPVYVPTTGGTVLGGWASGWIDVGPYGVRAAAINTNLNVHLSSALTAGSISVMACGTEE